MLIVIVLLVLIAIALLFMRSFREWLLEEIKELSDRLLLRFLLLTSRFESELTEDGRAEQKLWRAQRLRNLRGLTLRSRQRFGQSQS
ncbi:MAG TPA: hypothetical protein VGR30_20455 [Candidatus Binatia bacterium]|jgi:hypothetical protein|nr:hypothetical protein [Candidatus Binatia bacterium]